jgi:hypothetical protein
LLQVWPAAAINAFSMPVSSEFLDFQARIQLNGHDLARFATKNQMEMVASWCFFGVSAFLQSEVAPVCASTVYIGFRN